MSYIKYLITRFKKISVKVKALFIVLIIGVLLYPTISLSRYIYTAFLDRYYLSNDFYFVSDYLKDEKDNAEYTYTNWQGYGSKDIQISVSSMLNDLKHSESDITYDLDFCIIEEDGSCTRTSVDNYSVEMASSYGTMQPKKNRTIKSSIGTYDDTFSIRLNRRFGWVPKEGDEIAIKVTATSTKPYVKSITATFRTIIAGSNALEYEVMDKKGDLYSTLRITNANSSTTAKKIQVKLDPTLVKLDMTNQYFLDCQNDTSCEVKYNKYFTCNETFTVRTNYDFFGFYYEEYTFKKGLSYSENKINDILRYSNKRFNDVKNKFDGPYDFVVSFIVDVQPLSSVNINFYKADPTANYSLEYTNENLDNNNPISVATVYGNK